MPPRDCVLPWAPTPKPVFPFAPFSAPTLSRIGAEMGAEIGTSEVQKALDDLRDKSIVWRPARGVYALEDQDMRDWLLAETGADGAG